MERGGDDGALIERSMTDPAAFAGIFDRHAPVLLAYLVRRVGSADGEELLGELFRRAFESRGRYDQTRTDARPWLYGIAANLVMKHYRRRSRHDGAMSRLATSQGDPWTSGFEQSVVDRDHDAERLKAARRLIATLPERDREVAVLFAWEELTYEEIAEALDIPVGTVRSRLNRVRARLREPEAGEGESPDNGSQQTQEVHSDE